MRAYRLPIREIADHTTTDVGAEIETGGETLGYVTTDALTRSSEDLSFLEKEGRTVVDDEEYGVDVAEATTRRPPSTSRRDATT